jgi:uncharacterized protein YecT (DUF1311 family)
MTIMLRNATLVLCAFACFAVGALPASAQGSSQFDACDKNAKTQFDLHVCANNELILRNKQMQSVYTQILSRVAGQPAMLAKIKTMQNDWLTYVSAYLNALYPAANKQAEYGSIYPMEVDLARAELVAQHVIDLKAFIANLKSRSN